jgi:DNA-binding MarR family transcriptional regulator
MVQRMVEQQLIDRVEDPNDRRIKRISLTAEGKRLVNEVIALRRQWMETIGETLPEAARDQIVAALTRLNDTIKNIGSRTDAEHDK